MQDTTIIHLLQKYIDKRITEPELRFLLQWLKSAEDFSCIDLITKSLWDKTDENTTYPDERREHELRNEVFDLLEKIKKEKKRSSRLLPGKRKRWVLFSRIAAIFILAASVTLGLFLISNDSSITMAYTENRACKGEKKQIQLADGTKITLNSETSLRIPDNFNQRERIIEMSGEGFFEVAHNPEKPFIIKSGEAQVQVLGTSFDLKSYAEDDYIKLTVSTGKVRVNVPPQDLQLTVSKNEHLSISKIDGEVRKETIHENNYTKWMQGSLYFNKEPIREVIKAINRTYDRKVILRCLDCERVISGTHDNTTIEAIVNAICFTTGLHYRMEGENIIIYE